GSSRASTSSRRGYKKGVDGRNKSGHDERGRISNMNTTDDPLVSTDWLAAHLDDPKVRIIDATFKLLGVLPLPVDDYLAGHIPGAVFFDVDAVADHSNP